jgi:hypothetical protein
MIYDVQYEALLHAGRLEEATVAAELGYQAHAATLRTVLPLRQCHALAIVGGGGTIAEKENLLCLDHYVRRFFDLRKLQFYTVRKDASAGLTLVAWIRSLGPTIPTERNGFVSELKS